MTFEHELIYERYERSILLNEGGAAGHMAHPFDLPDVKTGSDLEKKFEETVKTLDKEGGSLKIDGTNVSIKLIQDEHGRKQFALDRGSQSQLDVNGVTIDKLEDRFVTKDGSVHGMINAGRVILNIFNQSLHIIKPQLEELGLWDDPTKFINAEFVQGHTNVIDYGEQDFLALHGINQFLEKYNREGQLVRPGLQRQEMQNPITGAATLEKGSSKAIPFDHKALDELAEKVKPVATEYKFDVITQTAVEKTGAPDFNGVLQQPFTVNYALSEVKEQPLKIWLSQANNPINYMLRRLDGKKVGAVSKQNYLDVRDGKFPLNELYEESDIEQAVDGAIIYHATVVMGDELLRNFTSKLGNTDTHEGIVVAGAPPYKVTGNFIIDGMNSKFRSSDEDDQSAPSINYGGGRMEYPNAQSVNYAASSKDPGGTTYSKYPGPGRATGGNAER
tara:strand:- start:1808 stop:3145 length:1338 start_codon:yes stop_codon:yes gene_type:complete